MTTFVPQADQGSSGHIPAVYCNTSGVKLPHSQATPAAPRPVPGPLTDTVPMPPTVEDEAAVEATAVQAMPVSQVSKVGVMLGQGYSFV